MNPFGILSVVQQAHLIYVHAFQKSAVEIA
jgi:hypothetical protein